MAALEDEAAGQGSARRPNVTGLIDAALVPLQTFMHHCWHQVCAALLVMCTIWQSAAARTTLVADAMSECA